VETLRRHAHVNGSVKVGCKPGPSTILTYEEEDKLADMGYGIQLWRWVL